MAEGSLRGLRMLEALSGMEQPVGLRAVAARTGLSESQAFRALQSLQQDGYVDHLGRRGYRLGSRSVALSILLGPRPALLRAVQPVVTRLAAATAQSAAMHLRSGEHRVLVVGVPKPGSPLRHTVALGERAPLSSGCGGQVILAHLPPEQREAALAARPATERRPSRAELERIREQGYALSSGDNHPGVSGIAVALLDPVDGVPLGSLTVATAEDGAADASMPSHRRVLQAAARDLAPRLAALLGPHSSGPLSALDVTVRNFLHGEPPDGAED